MENRIMPHYIINRVLLVLSAMHNCLKIFFYVYVQLKYDVAFFITGIKKKRIGETGDTHTHSHAPNP